MQVLAMPQSVTNHGQEKSGQLKPGREKPRTAQTEESTDLQRGRGAS